MYPSRRFEPPYKGPPLTRFARIGKHLVLELSTGTFLLNHLMLGVALCYGTEAEAPQRTFQVVLQLVDQRFFPGIGICYADELCWAAAVHPLRVAGKLSTAEEHQSWHAMKATLSEAVARGGYTETPFHAGDTFTGGYLPHLKVYDRGGEPCLRCGETIVQAEASWRKVFFCPHCQPQAPGVEPGRHAGEATLDAAAHGGAVPSR